ncbi:MAG: glycosyltransferase family 1 protein, partial [Verrucomicrobia bacterium]|nr:glycosyltransferase family 1 protein [Verrucomicrobiota bacterium]
MMLNWRDMENPKHGGAERVTQGYLAALARRGHEVYWYSEAFEGCAPTAEMDGVKVVRGGRNIVSRMILARKWYRRQPRFDLVI